MVAAYVVSRDALLDDSAASVLTAALNFLLSDASSCG